MANMTIHVQRNISKQGHTVSWSAFVNGQHIGDGKNRKEAVQIGEAHIRYLADRAVADIEQDHLEFDN